MRRVYTTWHIAFFLATPRSGPKSHTPTNATLPIPPKLRSYARWPWDSARPLYTVDDVRRMFASDRVRIEPAGLSWLTRVSNMTEDGGLRMVANLIRMARRVAEKSEGDGTITRSMLADAAAD